MSDTREIKSCGEYILPLPVTFKTRLLQVSFTLLYTAVVFFYTLLFGVIAGSWWMLVFLPFFVFGLFGITWKFTQAEIEYTVEAGELSVSKIYGRRTRKVLFFADLSEALLMAPLADPRAQSVLSSAKITKNYLIESDSPDAYLICFPDVKGKNGEIVAVETNAELLELFRMAKPSVFIRPIGQKH